MFLVSGGFVGRTLKIGAFREKRLNDSPALAHNSFQLLELLEVRCMRLSRTRGALSQELMS